MSTDSQSRVYADEIPACWRHSGDDSTAGLPDRQAATGNTTSAAGRETQSPNVAGEVDGPVDRPVGSSGRQHRPAAGQKPARNRPDTKCQRRRPSLELPANGRPPSPAAPAHRHAPAAAESSDSPRAPPNPAGPDLSSSPSSDRRNRQRDGSGCPAGWRTSVVIVLATWKDIEGNSYVFTVRRVSRTRQTCDGTT